MLPQSHHFSAVTRLPAWRFCFSPCTQGSLPILRLNALVRLEGSEEVALSSYPYVWTSTPLSSQLPSYLLGVSCVLPGKATLCAYPGDPTCLSSSRQTFCQSRLCLRPCVCCSRFPMSLPSKAQVLEGLLCPCCCPPFSSRLSPIWPSVPPRSRTAVSLSPSTSIAADPAVWDQCHLRLIRWSLLPAPGSPAPPGVLRPQPPRPAPLGPCFPPRPCAVATGLEPRSFSALRGPRE